MLTALIMSWFGLFWLPPLPAAVEVSLYQKMFAGVFGPASYEQVIEPPQIRIHTGRVVDKDGKPVGKAAVKLCGVKETGQNRFLYDLQDLAETETDEEGKFRFSEKDGDWQETDEKLVLARKEGFSLGWADWYAIGESAEEAIVLSDIAELAGKVVNEDGLAVPGAKVHVLLFPREEKWWSEREFMRMLASADWLTAMTDPAGGFVISYIPSRYTAEFVVQHEEYFEKMTWDALEYPDKGKYEAGAKDILITMSKGGVIRVKVADEQTGIGIPKVRVTAIKNNTDFSLSGITDLEGMAGLPCLPGEYRVVLGPWVYGDPQWRADAIGATVAAKGTTEVTLKAYVPSVLEVQVRDVSSGEPVPGIFISIRPVGGGQKYGEGSNEKGVARIDFLPPGKYEFETNISNTYEMVKIPGEIILDKSGIHSLEVKVSRLTTLGGVVTDGAGRFLSGVQVFILPGECPTFTTDTAGRYEIAIEDVEAARKFGVEQKVKPYLLFFYPAGNLGAIIDLPRGTKVKDVQLVDGFGMRGRVIDRNGIPLAGIKIFLDIKMESSDYKSPVQESPIQDVLTDSQGYYALDGIPRGQKYLLTVFAGDLYGEAKLNIVSNEWIPGEDDAEKETDADYPIRAGTPTKGLLVVEPNSEQVQVDDIVLAEAGLMVSGTVWGQFGERLPNVKVYMEGDGQGQFEPALTTENGKFILAGLVEGKIKLYTEYFEYKQIWYEQRMLAVNAGTKNIVIVLKATRNYVLDTVPKEGGLVEFLVRDTVTREPIDEVCLELKGREEVFVPDLFTDESGKTAIVLPEGTYSVAKSSKWEGYQNASIKGTIQISNGKKYQIELEMYRKPAYSGMVVDEQGSPVNGARLQLIPDKSAMTEDNCEVITAADGVFSFSWDPKEAFQEAEQMESGVFLVVTQERRNLAATFELTEASRENWKITLKKAPSITGIITDSKGKPIAAARINYEIILSRSNCLFEYEEIRSNEKGEYWIPALPLLPAGYEFRLDFSDSGYGSSGIPEVIIGAEELSAGESLVYDCEFAK